MDSIKKYFISEADRRNIDITKVDVDFFVESLLKFSNSNNISPKQIIDEILSAINK